MHPLIDLAKAYLSGQVTRTEYWARARMLRALDLEVPWKYIPYGKETGTPTALLQPIVRRLLQNYGAVYGDPSQMTNPDYNNATILVSERVEQLTRGTYTADSAYRQLQRIVNEEAEFTSNKHADYVLLALGETIGSPHIPLPFFPFTLKAAIEQIDAYLDATGRQMNDVRRQDLARTLYNFSVGYASAGRFTGDELALSHDARLARESKAREDRKAQTADVA